MNAIEQMNRICNKDRIFSGEFDLVIFGLDGVLAHTARLHAAAWKKMFNEFLLQQATENGESFVPFDEIRDYQRYVEGKPRGGGVESFLGSRGITLPYGKPGDPPGVKTVCGLSNRENDFFVQMVAEQGVEAFESSIRFVRHLREWGLKTAVVSTSCNGTAILDAANIAHLFDVRIDGNDITPATFPAKLHPDIYIEAARRTGVSPERAVIIEDALSRGDAGRRGDFGCVVGVDRTRLAQSLRTHGADVVVPDLAVLDNLGPSRLRLAMPLSAMQNIDSIAPQPGNQLAVFLDYDGTLTPIVSRPDKAKLPDAMRATLERLSHLCTIAIISGRDLADVRSRVGLEDIFYAGSHGFDIAGPGKEHVQYEQGTEYLSLLDHAEQELREELADVDGCLIERKRFSIAVHYRQVEVAAVQQVKERLADVLRRYTQLRLSKGKKVYELQPNIDWDKGKALRWLLKTLELNSPEVIPVYIGDDVTDEDAFATLHDDGVGILVSEQGKQTEARYQLENPDEVQQFLFNLVERLESRLE